MGSVRCEKCEVCCVGSVRSVGVGNVMSVGRKGAMGLNVGLKLSVLLSSN